MRALALALALLSGTALAQGTQSPGCPVNATCQAKKFSLLAGNTLCLNSTSCTTTLKADTTVAGAMLFAAGVANAASNVPFVFNNTVAFTTRKLLSVRDNGTEIASIDGDGLGAFATLSATSITVNSVTAGSGNPFLGAGVVSDTGAAVAAIVRNNAPLTSVGAKLLSGRVNVSTEVFYVKGNGGVGVAATDSSGTPGNATTTTPSGQAAFAGAAAAVTVTNTQVAATSICHAIMQQTDATCTSVISGVPGAGTVTFNANAACTGTTKFGWTCFN